MDLEAVVAYLKILLQQFYGRNTKTERRLKWLVTWLIFEFMTSAIHL